MIPESLITKTQILNQKTDEIFQIISGVKIALVKAGIGIKVVLENKVCFARANGQWTIGMVRGPSYIESYS